MDGLKSVGVKEGRGRTEAGDWPWPPLTGTAPEERGKIESDSAAVQRLE